MSELSTIYSIVVTELSKVYLSIIYILVFTIVVEFFFNNKQKLSTLLDESKTSSSATKEFLSRLQNGVLEKEYINEFFEREQKVLLYISVVLFWYLAFYNTILSNLLSISKFNGVFLTSVIIFLLNLIVVRSFLTSRDSKSVRAVAFGYIIKVGFYSILFEILLPKKSLIVLIKTGAYFQYVLPLFEACLSLAVGFMVIGTFERYLEKNSKDYVLKIRSIQKDLKKLNLSLKKVFTSKATFEEHYNIFKQGLKHHIGPAQSVFSRFQEILDFSEIPRWFASFGFLFLLFLKFGTEIVDDSAVYNLPFDTVVIVFLFYTILSFGKFAKLITAVIVDKSQK